MNAATIHTRYRDVRDRAFSLAVRSSFASFGPRSRISLPAQLQGTERITIGDHVYFGPGCWLLTHELDEASMGDQVGRNGGHNGLVGHSGPTRPAGHIEVGDRTSIAGYCVLSAAVRVSIGEGVLFARNVYIADHRHGFAQADLPILDQPIEDLQPVVVEDGAWLGQNVVLLPGVRIGKGAVVGANSVIREDVPPRCVAVGAPGRIVRRLAAA